MWSDLRRRNAFLAPLGRRSVAARTRTGIPWLPPVDRLKLPVASLKSPYTGPVGTGVRLIFTQDARCIHLVLLGGFAFSHQRGNKVSSTVFHFRLNDHQIAAAQKRAGELSIGRYAARLVLEDQRWSRINERKAIARTIRAIHLAVARGLPTSEVEAVDALLEEALALLESQHPKTSSEDVL